MGIGEGDATRASLAVVATHIAPARGYGGVAESVARLAKAWERAGHRIVVCASDASDGGPPIAAAQVGLSGRVLLYRARFWKRWGFGVAAPWVVAQACAAADRVYVAGIATWPTTLAALCCRLSGRPYVVAPRGGLMPSHLDLIRRRKPHKWLFYRLFTFPTLRAAGAIHATSMLEAEGVRRLFPDRPILVLGNGLDMRDWPVQPPRPADGSLVLAYAGRLAPEKGIDRFLKVWLACRRPGDRLLIAGDGGGDYARRVREAAAASGGAVDFRGYQDAAGIRRLFAEADMVVLPSGLEGGDVRENFGNAAAEAMASGRPLLVTRGLAWDGAAEAGAALTFDPDEADLRRALADAMAFGPERLGAMARAGRALVERDLEIGVVAGRLWRAMAARRDAG